MTFEQLLPNIRPWVEGLDDVWPGVFTKPYFAHFEVLHILALVILGGATIVLNLRLLGAGLTDERPSEIAQDMRPWIHVGVIGIIVSGILIGTANAERLYTSEAFTVKMLALAAGIILTYFVSLPIASAEGQAPPSTKVAFALGGAVFALALWIFAVGKLINPGLFHMLFAAGLIVAYLARGALRWAYLAGLFALIAVQFVVTHFVVDPNDLERLDPVNKTFAWVFAAWIFGAALAQAARAPSPAAGGATAKAAAYATILVWIVAGAAGRWIAFA